MGLTTKEIGSSSFNDMISSVDRRSEYVENRATANVTLNNFLTPYTLDNKSSILNAPCGYSNGTYASLRPDYAPSYIENLPFVTSEWNNLQEGWSIDETNNKLVAEATWTGTGKRAQYQVTEIGVGQTVRVSFDTVITAGSFKIGKPVIDNNVISTSGSYSLTGVATNDFLTISNQTTDFAGEITNIKVEVIEEADFDFSRGSSATRVNEKGLIEDVQILSGNLVQNGDFEEIGSELVPNNNFDTDSNWGKGDGWSIADGTANGNATFDNLGKTGFSFVTNKIYKVTYEVKNYVNGNIRFQFTGGATLNGNTINSNGIYTQYVKAIANHTNFRFRGTNFTGSIDNVSVKEVGQNWTLEDGWSMGNGKAVYDGLASTPLLQSNFSMTSSKKYRATIQVVDTSGNGNCRFAIKEDNNTAIAFTTYAEGTITLEFTSPTNGLFGIEASLSEGSFDITNVSVIEITDDTDIPRIDYTSGQGALLLEPQSTNKVTQSETFSTWSNTNASFTSVNLAAPDGSTSVIKMSSSTLGGGEHKVKFSIDTNPSTSSIFAKMGEVRYIMNRRQTPATSWQSVVFDLQEGVVAANNYSSNAYPKITHYGNGWYRCEVYYPSVNNNETGWGLSDGTNQLYNATNTTDGLYIWGAQQEDLSYATSYIPTEGSTVTRNAELADNSGNADLINSTEGVLYAEILKKQDNNDDFILISLNNDASNADANSVTLGFDAHIDFYFRVKSNNTVVLLSDTITANKNQFYKVALKYKSGDCAVWIDGVKQATSTTAFTFAQTLDNLSFDYRGNGQLPFYGNVKSVAVFKEALTDEELAQITSATQQEVFYEMRDRMNIKNYDYYEFGDYTTRLKKLF